MAKETERLDKIAVALTTNSHYVVPALSTSEMLYVALASDRLDLMPGWSIVGALQRLGEEWRRDLIEHQDFRFQLQVAEWERQNETVSNVD